MNKTAERHTSVSDEKLEISKTLFSKIIVLQMKAEKPV